MGPPSHARSRCGRRLTPDAYARAMTPARLALREFHKHPCGATTVVQQLIDPGSILTVTVRGSASQDWDRNRARPAVGGGFPFPTLSIVGRVHIPTMADVSRRPPIIPDGRISRVRFE